MEWRSGKAAWGALCEVLNPQQRTPPLAKRIQSGPAAIHSRLARAVTFVKSRLAGPSIRWPAAPRVPHGGPGGAGAVTVRKIFPRSSSLLPVDRVENLRRGGAAFFSDSCNRSQGPVLQSCACPSPPAPNLRPAREPSGLGTLSTTSDRAYTQCVSLVAGQPYENAAMAKERSVPSIGDTRLGISSKSQPVAPS